MLELTTIPFHNQSLITSLINNVPHVAMRPICQNIGLDWKAQHRRITKHPVLKSTVVMMTTVAEDRKAREMLMLPLNMLNGWLFGVDVYRVKPEIKEKLIEYQKECFDVLSNHFIEKRNGLISLSEPVNIMPNPHRYLVTLDAHTQRNEITPIPFACSVVTEENIESVISFIKPGYLLVKRKQIDALESELRSILS